MASKNTAYQNEFLKNEIEDQYLSHINLQSFCTIDNSLVGTAGMKVTVNTYKGTGTAEKLAIGEGNTTQIQAGFTAKSYEILLAQSRAQYYDEDAMTDTTIVPTLATYQATDLFNVVNKDIFAAFNTASLTLEASDYGFGTWVDAQAKLNKASVKNEDLASLETFAFVNPDDMAAIRKALKDDLKYVEAFVKNGYVGTVAGVNLYIKKDAVAKTIVMGTRQAVTLFNKPGVSTETTRDANTRDNMIYSRKYYVAALTDETQAIKITIGG